MVEAARDQSGYRPATGRKTAIGGDEVTAAGVLVHAVGDGG